MKKIILSVFSFIMLSLGLISAQQILHPVVVEEATGTWCGFCVRGAVYMDQLTEKYGDDFVGIAVHNGTNDPMVVPTYDQGTTNFPNFSGFPSAIVARKHLVSPEDIETPFLQEAAIAPTVDLTATATYDKVTRELVVNLSSTTTKNYVAPKFFIALIEDGVTGTSAGYNQSNYYSGGSLGPMGGFENLPNPVPANQMVYNHVARALFGGFNGLSGSIKSPWLANKTATYEYSGYIIPEEFNIAKCHVVVGVMSNENKFLNAAKISLEEATASVTLNADHKVMISPNPIYGTSYIQVNNPNAEDLSIKMYNNFGVMVASQNYGRMSGLNSLPIVSDNLGSGTYFIHVLIGNERVVKQIAVVK